MWAGTQSILTSAPTVYSLAPPSCRRRRLLADNPSGDWPVADVPLARLDVFHRHPDLLEILNELIPYTRHRRLDSCRDIAYKLQSLKNNVPR